MVLILLWERINVTRLGRSLKAPVSISFSRFPVNTIVWSLVRLVNWPLLTTRSLLKESRTSRRFLWTFLCRRFAGILLSLLASRLRYWSSPRLYREVSLISSISLLSRDSQSNFCNGLKADSGNILISSPKLISKLSSDPPTSLNDKSSMDCRLLKDMLSSLSLGQPLKVWASSLVILLFLKL